MKRFSIHTLTLVLAIMVAPAWAQDFRNALEELYKKYRAAENVQMKMSIDVFEAPGMRRPFYQEKVLIAKQGQHYHYKLPTTDMIMNEKYIVVVDHPMKQIMIGKRDVQSESNFYKQTQFNIDSIFQLYEEGKYEGSNDGVNKFSIIQKSGAIMKVELLIHQQTGELSQVNYLYRTGQWATIVFNEFTLSPTFDRKEFDEQQFVKRSGKKWQPASTLAGYSVAEASDSGIPVVN